MLILALQCPVGATDSLTKTNTTRGTLQPSDSSDTSMSIEFLPLEHMAVNSDIKRYLKIAVRKYPDIFKSVNLIK